MAILTSGQQKLLRAFGARDFFRSNFVLTGGTALAAFYLHHRLSEDLDLFTGDPLIAAHMRAELEAAAQTVGCSVELLRSFPTFLDARVNCDGELIAIHLALDTPFHLEPPIEHGDAGLLVESALDLAANKLAALYGRASAKDFVDVYFAHHEILPINDLIPKAEQKSPGLEPYWLARAFLQVRQIASLPVMLKPLTLDCLKAFFINQSEQLMTGGSR
ncbi:MAG: nucleotidyl transferase AbiEii/AbiGii toxin family protein [Candidatus Sumerlaeia bacterium]|nr:nucleotidyl transferase AbiEii/AbiGii toxin family protein [Candidatus Sumerlaeia bacterium]